MEDVGSLRFERMNASLHKQELKERVAKIRDKNLPLIPGLWKRAEAEFRKNRTSLYFAKDAKEACRMVARIAKGKGTIVKSKTNVGLEIKLKDYLRDRGVRVVETDCGDYIVDVLKQDAVHPINPALAVAPEKLAGRFGTADPKKIKEAVRKKIGSEFEKAKVGITGANFVSADGSVVLIENEGNIAKVLTRPVLIIVTSIEKIVKDRSEAMLCAEAQSIFATDRMAKLIHFISGPSGTGDLGEYQGGMHGAEEVHIVVVDNGRSELMKDESRRDILKCINCGLCVLSCPVFPHVGLEQSGMRGVAIESGAARYAGLEEAWKCTGCGLCEKVCPIGIDLHKIALAIRRKLAGTGRQTASNKKMIENVKKTGNSAGKIAEDRGARELVYCC